VNQHELAIGANRVGAFAPSVAGLIAFFHSVKRREEHAGATVCLLHHRREDQIDDEHVAGID
jgi:hypothetical protein